MAFNSFKFIFLFLPLAVILYNLSFLFKKPLISKIIIVITSMVFLLFFGWEHLVIIVASLVLNYLLSMLLKKQSNNKSKKIILISTIVLNVLILFIPKYLNFFYSSIVSLFNGTADIINILVPLGISYITFQQIAYAVDNYKNEDVEHSFIDYCVFILFFPKIVCGPIVFQKDFMPQLNDSATYKTNYENLFRGLYTFIIGLAKKVIIADTLATLVNTGFGNIEALSALDAIVVMLSYSMQIYFDFSGYCDMACGVSQMFNLKITNNFEDPYQADSVLGFWKSWHISLTTFLRKYIYFPLGGSKKGQVRTILNILAIFVISGLWHGANWTFILWGVIHGVFNVIMRYCDKWWNKIHSALRWLLNFIFINFTWIIFRADSISDVKTFFNRFIVGDFSFHFDINYLKILGLAFIIILGFKTITNKEFKINWQRIVVGSILLLLSLLLFSSNSITFLYSNF